ncbi:hypothetical protein Tco_0868710 [Tanacetum coccineum]
MSKLLYTRFTKLIIDYILSHNKSIPRRSDSKLHSSQDDQPITKLLSMTNGDYKFGMEVPDAMISDAIKKKAGYTYYIAKKVKSEKAIIVDEPEEQHVSPVQNGKGKGFIIQEPCTQQRQRSQLTINSQTNEAVTDMYNEWGQKLKGPAVEDPAVQSLLDLRKRSKASRLENTDSDATLYSSSSNKTEESANETDDVDESDMGLSNDNPDEANDDASKENSLSYNNSPTKLTLSQSKEADAKGKKEYEEDQLQEGIKADEPIYESKSNMTHPTNQKLYDTLYESIYLDHDALNVQDAESPFHKWSHDNQDSPNNRGGGDKKKHQKDVSEPSSRSSRRNKSLVIHEQSGSTGATKRNTPWFDLLLKLDIDKNENHILGPSTIAIVKKLKAIIQKDELTIANLEGCQTRKAKATNSDEGDVSKPKSYLVDLSMEDNYTTSITKHYAARYYKEGIKDKIPKRWSKEVRRYHFEALNVRRFDDKEYEFNYADLPRLSVNGVEDIRTVIKNMVEEIQLGVESYQRTLNLTKPTIFFERIDQRKLFTMTATQKGVIQENPIDMVSNNKLGSDNKMLKGKDWTDYDVKSLKEMLKKIDEILRHIEQLRRLEEYVGGHLKTVNPSTFVRPM